MAALYGVLRTGRALAGLPVLPIGAVNVSRQALASSGVNYRLLRLCAARHFSSARRSGSSRMNGFVDNLRGNARGERPASRRTAAYGEKPPTSEVVEAELVTSKPAEAAVTASWAEWSLRYAAALVVRRQLEPLNLFLGFEQANRYAIEDDHGRPVAYLVEEETALSSTIARQLLRTRRPFRAVVLDHEGRVVLRLRRPFTFINTRLFISDAEDQPIGEVWQRWHLWRRRYELFVREHQFAEVDAGFLAWRFDLYNEQGDTVACVDRRFGGFAREIFTDTGQYALLFHPDYLREYEGVPAATAGQLLDSDERAVALACAIGIDFDYFSRHSSHGPGFFPMPFFGFGGGDAYADSDS
ncbi:Scramblase-domain-containing protein [Thamnocephalis sphaerospora]|uniref:Phospholipid scramblase n=1 Tax=Thamnocephalis sphaerospora TaxID=78915 RepID=A0A4P9XLE8_9FUNG|nr:Scramblase-domain-containing protein [Thamnocephalis sphaerospora]|eukprot:RKP06688.1 Scramblase-domain-containing protein [Thamnocephalis sphaerospora]